MYKTTMSFYKVTINMLSAIIIAMLNAISMLRTTVLHHNYAKCYSYVKCYMHAMCNSTLTILSVIAT